MTVRQAAVAGTFYPADGNELRRMLEDAPRDECAAGVAACIVPHAGYMFSLGTAMRTLSAARSGKYRCAVIVGPSHHFALHGFALSSCDNWATPLGEVRQDLEARDAFASAAGESQQTSDRIHAPEHALEVQLPVLRNLLPGLPVVPVIMGEMPLAETRRVAANLRKTFSDDTLWIVSSDFTHYGRGFGYVPFRENVREQLKKLDLGAVGRICSGDANSFAAYVAETGATICGAQPIRLLLAMNECGSAEPWDIRAVEYTSSGEVTGDWSHVVGYAGIRFFKR